MSRRKKTPTASDALANIASATTDRKNEVLALWIGTCSYTITAAEPAPPTPAPEEKSEDEDSGIPVWAVAGGLAAFALLVAAGAVFYFRRAKSSDLEQELANQPVSPSA